MGAIVGVEKRRRLKHCSWKVSSPGKGTPAQRQVGALSWTDRLSYHSDHRENTSIKKLRNQITLVATGGIRVLETLKTLPFFLLFVCLFGWLVINYWVQFFGPQRKSVYSKKSEKHVVREGRAPQALTTLTSPTWAPGPGPISAQAGSYLWHFLLGGFQACVAALLLLMGLPWWPCSIPLLCLWLLMSPLCLQVVLRPCGMVPIGEGTAGAGVVLCSHMCVGGRGGELCTCCSCWGIRNEWGDGHNRNAKLHKLALGKSRADLY